MLSSKPVWIMFPPRGFASTLLDLRPQFALLCGTAGWGNVLWTDGDRSRVSKSITACQPSGVVCKHVAPILSLISVLSWAKFETRHRRWGHRRQMDNMQVAAAVPCLTQKFEPGSKSGAYGSSLLPPQNNSKKQGSVCDYHVFTWSFSCCFVL